MSTRGRFCVCAYPRWGLWRLAHPKYWARQTHFHYVKDDTTYEEAYHLALTAAESGAYRRVDVGSVDADGDHLELFKRWENK